MSIPFHSSLEMVVANGVVESISDGTTTLGRYWGTADPEGSQIAAPGSTYQRSNGSVYVKATGTGNTGWSVFAAGTITTDLGYTASAANGIVTNTSGLDATIPLGTTTNAGLMAPADKVKSDFISITQAVDLDALELDVADLTTLTGLASNTASFGTFTVLPDNADLNAILTDIDSRMAGLTVQSVAADITARDAQTGQTSGDLTYVTDAIADPTVTSGAALYVWDGAAYQKISEFESLDVVSNLALGTNDGLTQIVTNSNGTGVTIPTAVAGAPGTAGLMSGLDKQKVDRTDSFTTLIGDGATTSFTVTHNLGTKNYSISVHEEGGSFREIYPEIQRTSTTASTVIFSVAPAANAYRVVVNKVNQA